MPTRADVLEDLTSKARIDPHDVLAARAVLFTDMHISADEAEALFLINDGARSTCPEWRMLFIEAITDFVVRQQQPSGYVDEAKANWLAARIASDGRVDTETELELLLHVLDHAEEAPATLSKLALDYVADFALAPDRREDAGAPLTADEVGLIRRAVFTVAGCGGGAAVSHAEAEVLFDINDAARGKANDPAWTEFFGKAVGACLMAAAGYRPPSRDEALRREAWLHAPTRGVAGLLADVVRSNPLKGIKAVFEPTVAERHNADVDYRLAASAPVEEAEVRWLTSRIGRDGVLDENERAVLQFIRAECPDIHPTLKPLLESCPA